METQESNHLGAQGTFKGRVGVGVVGVNPNFLMLASATSSDV